MQHVTKYLGGFPAQARPRLPRIDRGTAIVATYWLVILLLVGARIAFPPNSPF